MRTPFPLSEAVRTQKNGSPVSPVSVFHRTPALPGAVPGYLPRDMRCAVRAADTCHWAHPGAVPAQCVRARGKDTADKCAARGAARREGPAAVRLQRHGSIREWRGAFCIDDDPGDPSLRWVLRGNRGPGENPEHEKKTERKQQSGHTNVDRNRGDRMRSQDNACRALLLTLDLFWCRCHAAHVRPRPRRALNECGPGEGVASGFERIT